MFYRFLIVLMFLCSGIVSAASSAEKVYRITYVQKSDKWYKEQAMLWKKILQADESNEQAWMNYYYANRYAHLDVDSHFDENKQQRLDDILAEIKKHIPDTYTYYYISALNAQNINEFDINALEYAHHRWPEKPDILYELILYHEVKGNKEKVLLYSRELYESQDIARGLLEYNANMLLSVKPGSILFTNGDNDTYPALVLQNAHSFQSNILVINIHMAFSYREYLSRLLADNNMIIDVDKLSEQNITRFFSEFVAVLSEKYPKKNIYMAATLNASFVDLFKENLYLVGLTYQYSKERMDNLAVLKENTEKKLRLDYLSNDWYNEKYPAKPLVEKLNQNYIVIFMNLAEYLAERGETTEARYYRNRAAQLANQSHNQKMIQKIKESRI